MNQLLAGVRILNTRPKHQAQLLNEEILQAGGIPVECPTLEIRKTSLDWINSLPDLNKVNHAIFISPNAVHYCFSQLASKKINWPESINVIAIGQGTAKILAKFNIQVHEIPDIPDSEHLVKLKSLATLKDQSVLLFKGESGRKLIEDTLVQQGAHLICLSVYKRIIPRISHQFINSLWHNDLVDIILLTSEQSMHNLFQLFGKEAHQWLQNKPCLVISERLAKAASLLGVKEIIVCHPDRMINTLLDYYQGLIHGQ